MAVISNWREFLCHLTRPSDRELVIADTFGRFGVLAFVLSARWRLPLVVRMRGDLLRETADVLSSGDRKDLGYQLRRQIGDRAALAVLRRSRLVIVNSDYMRRRMESAYGISRTAVVHNPFTLFPEADSQRVVDSLPAGRLQLLTLTHFRYTAKVEPLIEAVRGWLPRDAFERLDIQWLICGEGPHRSALQKAVLAHGLSDRVHVLGNRRDVPRLLNWSHIVVHLTRLDTFPNSLLEAMAFERPIITNRESCGSREQVLHDQNGYVVGSSGEFLTALERYGADPALRKRHGSAGHGLLEERFTVDAVKPSLHSALQQAAR